MSTATAWLLAGAAWAGALAPSRPALALPAAGVLLGVTLLLRNRLGVALLLVAVTCGLGAALRVDRVLHGPLATLVGERGRAVELRASVVGDPHEQQQGGAWVLARLSWVMPGGGERVRSRERVVLRLSASNVDSARFGGEIDVVGRADELDHTSGVGAWFRDQGVVVEVAVASLHERAPPPGWARATTWLRGRLASAARAHLPAAESSLLTGLVTGDTSGQPQWLGDAVEDAGLSHLVAVSGSNIALVVAGVLGPCLLLGAGRRTGWWLALVAVWWFVVLVRAEPSVVRAAVLATLVVAARLVGRRRDVRQLLASAVVLALLVDPLLAHRLGFVLSVAATLGVLVIAPLIHEWLRGPTWFRALLAATAGAQLAVMPVLALVGEQSTLAALPANLVAVPAAAAGSAIGGLVALVALVAPSAAGASAVLAGPFLWLVAWSARTFAGGVGDQVNRLWPWVLVAVGAAALARAGPRLPWALAPVVTVVVVAGAGIGPRGSLPSSPVMTVLDVGQGDAILVGDPTAGWMLIDGGPDGEVLQAALRRHEVERLAVAVLTHPHADHQAGLQSIIGELPIGAAVVGPGSEAFASRAAGAGIPVTAAAAGDTWQHGVLTVRVLSPSPGGFGEGPNNDSLVLRLDPGGGPQSGASVLLTGDAEALAQLLLLRDPAQLDVGILKVPHHGGDTNIDGFLDATTPSLAVISVGEGNDFGHPDPDVLADLAGIDVRRTDQAGDVTVSLGRWPAAGARASAGPARSPSSAAGPSR